MLVVGCGTRRPIATSTPTHVVTAAVPTVPTTVGVTPPPATPTSTRTATPSPTPTPILAWDVSPKTGIAHVDAIIAAVVAGNAVVLEQYLTGSMEPCTGYPFGYPSCPPGVSAGTLVRAITGAGCPGDGNPRRLVVPPLSPPTEFTDATTPADVVASIVQRGIQHLVGVYKVSPAVQAHQGIQFRLVFQRELRDTRGFYLGVTDQGISEVVGSNNLVPGCGTPSATEIAIVPPP